MKMQRLAVCLSTCLRATRTQVACGQATLRQQQAVVAKLDAAIAANLKGLGYGG